MVNDRVEEIEVHTRLESSHSRLHSHMVHVAPIET